MYIFFKGVFKPTEWRFLPRVQERWEIWRKNVVIIVIGVIFGPMGELWSPKREENKKERRRGFKRQVKKCPTIYWIKEFCMWKYYGSRSH